MSDAIIRALFVILSFLSSVFFLVVSDFYARKIRKIYPHRLAAGEYCSLCGEKLVGEKFIDDVFLFFFPYASRILRHYEKKHKEISRYARRLRLSLTLFMILLVHSFAAGWGTKNMETVIYQDVPWTEIALYFLIPYITIQLIVWASISFIVYLLLWKKKNSDS